MPDQLEPFQRHLMCFAESHPPHRLTLPSVLRTFLSLGLNFPISLALSLTLRIWYSSFPSMSPLTVRSVPKKNFETQLQDAKLTRPSYSCAEILNLAGGPAGFPSLQWALNTSHLLVFWTTAASVKTGLVDREDVERFQMGDWVGAVAKRRRSRLAGKGEVLPFWRGGPISVAGHSWAVGTFFGVKVYEGK